MRPASTLRGSPSLAPVTAPRHACPRCHGRLVQLEEPTCLPCGWADYSLPGLTCRICREPLTGDRQRYCSTGSVTAAVASGAASPPTPPTARAINPPCGPQASTGGPGGARLAAAGSAPRPGSRKVSASPIAGSTTREPAKTVSPLGHVAPPATKRPSSSTSAASCKSPAVNEVVEPPLGRLPLTSRVSNNLVHLRRKALVSPVRQLDLGHERKIPPAESSIRKTSNNSRRFGVPVVQQLKIIGVILHEASDKYSLTVRLCKVSKRLQQLSVDVPIVINDRVITRITYPAPPSAPPRRITPAGKGPV